MSQHPSLRIDSVGAKHRNVLTRSERIKTLKEQNKWQDRISAFGLPKVKSMKIKVKKVKEAPAVEGAEAGAVAPATAAAGKTAAGTAAKPAAAQKPAAGGKEAAAKTDKAAPKAKK